MDEEIKRLLFTTKDGRWYWETDYANDHLELDEEDIDFSRIPAIRKLLIKPVTSWPELATPLKAAEVLTSWGDEEGLKYLEYVVALRPDKWGNGEPHRLRLYDTTYEWILRAVISFNSVHFDSTPGDQDPMRDRVFDIISKIMSLSESLEFDFVELDWMNDNNYTEYDAGLKSYLRAMLADDTGFHHHKPGDAVKFFLDYDPAFLKSALQETGKQLSDFKEYI